MRAVIPRLFPQEAERPAGANRPATSSCEAARREPWRALQYGCAPLTHLDGCLVDRHEVKVPEEEREEGARQWQRDGGAQHLPQNHTA